jgi:hypothetical protein
MNKDTENNRAEQQAASQLDSIREMVAALNSPDEDTREDAMTSIQEDPLSVAVRSDWASTPSEFVAEEFQILLCTGGPAVRIIGELDRGEPCTASLEYQDWFTSWEQLPITDDDERVLLDYSRCFYFGE